MLDQVLTALAASGGTAVVAAAGTDTWAGTRQAVARWLGRGDARRELDELERLDRTRADIQAADPADIERARIRLEGAWQTRIETVLESLSARERDQAADQLRGLLAQHAPQGATTAGPGGLAVGGNMNVRADGSSIAAGVISGGAHTGTPPVPDPSQG